MQTKAFLKSGRGLGVAIVAIVCLNIIAARFYGRVDVTEDKVFSLSEGTFKILENLDDEVVVKFYFSRANKELPVVVKTYATRVEEVLREYAASSGGKMSVESIDPRPDTDEEEWAQKYGIVGNRLPKGGQMYFGAVLLAGKQEIAIPYFDPRREEFLEYDLSEALVRIFQKDKPKIGVMSSLDIMGGGNPMAMMGRGQQQGWVFVNDLKRNFDVQKIEVTAKEISSDLSTLIVVHPKKLSETALYAIDQYVVRGGRAIIAVDPMSRTDMASNQHSMMGGRMPETNSDLGKLFTAWNVQFNPSEMVGDTKLGTQINAGGAVVNYPYFMSLGEGAFSKDSVITGNLKQMLFAEGGSISSSKESPYRFEPLITTTDASGTSTASMAAFMSPQDMARDIKLDQKKRTLAALITGKFKSAFPTPPAPADGEEGTKAAHQSEAAQETTVLIVADVDFLADRNSVRVIPFFNQKMVRVINDNLNFLFNAADFLGGSQDLISIRSRGRIARPFTRVAEIQKEAHKEWKAKEEQLTSQLQDLQKKLNDLQQERTDGNRFVLSPEQQREIERFREEERKIKRERRLVRRKLREDIEVLGYVLIAANMLAVPMGISGFGFGVFLARSRRMRQDRSTGAKHGKQ